MAKYSIVIAEDDIVLRDLYLRKFSKNVYDIRTASNGEETLALIQAKIPDLLILDMNMPVLDGFGVLEKLPKDSRPFPVVVLTNFADQANRDRGESLHVDDYFAKKDMTIKALLEMVERLLRRGKKG